MVQPAARRRNLSFVGDGVRLVAPPFGLANMLDSAASTNFGPSFGLYYFVPAVSTPRWSGAKREMSGASTSASLGYGYGGTTPNDFPTSGTSGACSKST